MKKSKNGIYMSLPQTSLEAVVIRFAGDSGDGMQTVGELFTDTTARSGNDIRTFPNYPAEIRAPKGTLAGVSGFQLQFGSSDVSTAGDDLDALVAMNPAALKVNLNDLTDKGLLLVNEASFTKRNWEKAGYDADPLEGLDVKYQLIRVDMDSMTKETLKGSPLKPAQKQMCKNFFALGFMLWVYDRPLTFVTNWIAQKWAGKAAVIEANTDVLKAGYFYGETCESMTNQYTVSGKPGEGLYRKISGNEATALGLVAAGELSGLQVIFGSYPITPASPILEQMSQYKNFGIKTIQAEDELSAAGIAVGAGFSGNLGVTSTSGPGVSLKGEMIGLGVMAELPMVIINVQRGGPSTGLPTKTEQADLEQALYSLHGESPMPVLAARSPADCFDCILEASRIALRINSPVMFLSDGLIAMGSEPWKIPDVADLEKITVKHAPPNSDYINYKRDPETLARTLAVPGTPGLEHQIGGLEKDEAGHVSYDPMNHQEMCRLRQAKVDKIAEQYPPLKPLGEDKGELLVLSWGSTYGAVSRAVRELQQSGKKLSLIHLRHLNPLPLDLKDYLNQFDKILIPEINHGQLAQLIRGTYLKEVEQFNILQGRPFKVSELKEKMLEYI